LNHFSTPVIHMMDCSFCAQKQEEKRRVSKGVDNVLRSKDPVRSFNGRPYAVQPLRDTAARDVFFYAL